MILSASGGASTAGGVQVLLNNQNLGTINVSPTGSWNTYQNFTIPNVTISGGTKIMRLTVVDGAKLNIDKITFVANGGPSCTPGASCDDGNANTTNDVYDSNCVCAGTPSGPSCTPGASCDDGNANTANDVYDSNCVCAGTPTSTSGTITLDAIHDAYLQGSTRYNTSELRVENGNRVAYLKYDLSNVPGTVTSAQLKLKVGSDSGNGTIVIQKGNSNNWTETNISNSNKPGSAGQIGTKNSTYSGNQTYTWNLTASAITGNTISFLVVHTSGNDVSFKSSENSDAAGRPKLVLNYTSSKAIVGNDPSPIRLFQTATIEKVNIFPNPFNNSLQVNLQAGVFSRIELVDLHGRIIQSRNIDKDIGQVTLSFAKDQLSSGLHFVRLFGENQIVTKKVIHTK